MWSRWPKHTALVALALEKFGKRSLTLATKVNKTRYSTSNATSVVHTSCGGLQSYKKLKTMFYDIS